VPEAIGVCPTCDSQLEAHQGPSAPWRYDYLVEEIAASLLALGQGETYTAVAERARAQAWNGRRAYHRGPTTVVNGQLVANWLATFGPVVCEPRRETGWPETLVLDSTEFVHTDRWTGQRSQLFTVPAAYGYPAGQRHRKHLDSTGGRPTHSVAIADQGDADGRRAYSLRA
jgi:hypothetical protein